ncbi:hypothetical protein ATK36_4540 [Amycolatopsis sulphurea]|uniref:SpaA-like prealbumin fold domain-containing protein n=1 Tax=Amycolatopsis sulphurea TaxID=76022 RepID=A0A2A9FE05_9PSEU|nr:hypothetical protein [Amycolatopsis sulphurea]PFG49388.1 hypothetical protein ATK36_4540 [Amycolatopsis sulphurea]
MGWISRPRARMRAVSGLVATAMLGALSVTAVGTTPAMADTERGVGHEVRPGQPVASHTPTYNWLGSYHVGGKDVFCVSFQLKAPDSNQEYKPGDELLTKWGTKLPADEAANISYLLLRYGNTKDADQAAALAHLLHSWTSKPRNEKDLDKSLPAEKIGYDTTYHLNKLKEQAPGAYADVDKLTADAEANRGPWTASMAGPKDPQHLDAPASWTVTVKNAKGTGVADVPVKLTATDASIDSDSSDAKQTGSSGKDAKQTSDRDAKETNSSAGDAKQTGNGGSSATQAAKTETTVKTDAEGKVTVKLTPTGAQPKLAAAMSAPADRPYVQKPLDNGIQKVVSTGGEKTLTATGTVAIAKPGKVQIAKKDAKTGKGIGGATLRVTGKDRKSAATGQDGKPLNGPDGKPVVVTTNGEEGVATVENLLAPQEVCVVEVNAPPGYTNAFDPNNPPTECGSLEPGGTLSLALANTPNEVPHAIPAGDQPVAMAKGTTETTFSVPGVAGLGALVLLGSGLVGFFARRSARR